MERSMTLLTGMMTGLIRIIPNTFNFTPIGALGLFGGAKLKSWHAFALPIVVMLVTDIALWGVTGQLQYSPFHLSRLYVYTALLGYVLIGKVFVKSITPKTVVAASLLGSLQFFLITNFCDWLFQPFIDLGGWPAYTRDFNGLVTCYLNGLPFYNGGELFFFGLFAGDLFFSGCLFGLYSLTAQNAEAKVALQTGGEAP